VTSKAVPLLGQVDDQGRSWRSGAVVERKHLKQWFLRITQYAQVRVSLAATHACGKCPAC
jgi:leucyl-tRNA synthetase